MDEAPILDVEAMLETQRKKTRSELKAKGRPADAGADAAAEKDGDDSTGGDGFMLDEATAVGDEKE